jgi:subtilisin-like proprotein convertase family protein
MKKIVHVFVSLLFVCISVNCSKSNGNSDGIPLVPNPGGQVGFANTTTIPIEPTPSNGQPGGGGPVETISEINVPIAGTITDKNKFIVEMNIQHSQQGKISISLVAPNGFEYLFVRKAGSTGKYIATNKLRFSAAFTNSLPNTGLDFPAGDYKESDGPLGNPVPLTPIFSQIQGTSIQGLWQLKIVDESIINSGSLLSWRLIFN